MICPSLRSGRTEHCGFLECRTWTEGITHAWLLTRLDPFKPGSLSPLDVRTLKNKQLLQNSHRHPIYLESIKSNSESIKMCVAFSAGPVINRAPSSIGVDILKNVSLPCSASGVPAPTITWLHGGQELVMEGNFRQRQSGALVIKGKGNDSLRYFTLNTKKFSLISEQIFEESIINIDLSPRDFLCHLESLVILVDSCFSNILFWVPRIVL